VSLSAAVIALATASMCTVTSPASTVALVELYTSQGCSSCPPADHWLTSLSDREQVVPLALHVGYWDDIGWKDPFAQEQFATRQYWLASANGRRGVYTPGVFVQGREFQNWRQPSDFRAAVQAINQRPARARIELAARLDEHQIEVRPQFTTQAAATHLRVALVQDGFTTVVKAGENVGATLHNDRVVREWSAPLSPAPAALQWSLPPNTPRARLSLVAFVEDDARGDILQAVSLPLRDCGAAAK